MKEQDINDAKMEIAGVEGTLEMLSKCDWRTPEELKTSMARMANELKEAREKINTALIRNK